MRAHTTDCEHTHADIGLANFGLVDITKTPHLAFAPLGHGDDPLHLLKVRLRLSELLIQILQRVDTLELLGPPCLYIVED